MENNPFNEILQTLGNSIESINDKISAGQENVRNYKANIVERLGDVIEQLKGIQNNPIFKTIPSLRGELQNAKSALAERTNELAQTKTQLDNANASMEDLRKQIEDVNLEIRNKNEELQRIQDELTNQKNETTNKDSAIADLNNTIEQLNKQREELEGQLNTSKSEIDDLINRLSLINNQLVDKIGLIDRITQGLNVDDPEISDGFKLIADNIQAIMNMINNPDTTVRQPPVATAATKDEAEKYYNLFLNSDQRQKDLFYRQIDTKSAGIIQQNLRGANNGESAAIEAIKRELSSDANKDKVITYLKGSSGGKRKRNRRTMKRRGMKRGKKTYKGGYVYKSDKSLDKASSIVSPSLKTTSSVTMKKRIFKKRDTKKRS